MKQIKMTCDHCAKEELFFENSGLPGWNQAKLTAGKSWMDFTICDGCWIYSFNTDDLRKNLWSRFLEKVGVK